MKHKTNTSMKHKTNTSMKHKTKLKSKPKHKTKTKKITVRKNKKKINSIYDGGAAFTKGGFGCLFKPALNCKDSHLNTPPKYVSKLIDANHGKREYMYIYNIKKRLEHLPANIKKYFLLDNVTICEPKPLSEEDKVKIEKVCDNILTDNSVNSQNINNNLDKFKIINMPELSISLSNYIKKKTLTPFQLVNINNSIIKYLTVIIPILYKNGVVHGDIKPDNMMFDMSENNTLVIIDWGLSYMVGSDRKNVPEALYRLGVQWHQPFSSFLFKKNTIEKYDNFLQKLKKEGTNVTRNILRLFAKSEYEIFMSKHNKQFLFLSETLMNVYGEELTKKLKNTDQPDVDNYIYNMAINYIIEYITDVLMTYTINYKLELGRYFHEVYLINADTWGLMSTYSELTDVIHLMTKMTSVERQIINGKLITILIENLFKNGSKIINIPKLVDDIKNLNKYLMSIVKKETIGTVRNYAVSAYGSKQMIDFKKSIVDKGLMENKIIFDKLEKNSNNLKSRLREIPPNIQVPLVTGGYKTRKT